MYNKLLPAKVNQIATHLPGHCDGPACSQPVALYAASAIYSTGLGHGQPASRLTRHRWDCCPTCRYFV